MLGDGEVPSYEECHECPPVPDYCSTGQTVLDPCGCCEECAKGEKDVQMQFLLLWAAVSLLPQEPPGFTFITKEHPELINLNELVTDLLKKETIVDELISNIVMFVETTDKVEG